MDKQEVNRKYEYKVLLTINDNFEAKLQEAESEGWERIGQVLLSKGGAYNNDTCAYIPMRREVNNSKIEVGKVYKHNATKSVYMITGDKTGYGIGIGCDLSKVEDFKWNDVAEYYTEATKEEWEKALTKYADELYKGVKEVSRYGMNLPFPTNCDINSFEGSETKWHELGFMYNSTIVMDKHGNWAKPIIEEKEIVARVVKGMLFQMAGTRLEDGEYKLTKID